MGESLVNSLEELLGGKFEELEKGHVGRSPLAPGKIRLHKVGVSLYRDDVDKDNLSYVKFIAREGELHLLLLNKQVDDRCYKLHGKKEAYYRSAKSKRISDFLIQLGFKSGFYDWEQVGKDTGALLIKVLRSGAALDGKPMVSNTTLAKQDKNLDVHVLDDEIKSVVAELGGNLDDHTIHTILGELQKKGRLSNPKVVNCVKEYVVDKGFSTTTDGRIL